MLISPTASMRIIILKKHSEMSSNVIKFESLLVAYTDFFEDVKRVKPSNRPLCPTVLISTAQTLISCLLLSKTVCCHTSRHIPCDMMVSISCYVINEFQQRVLLKSAKTKSNTVRQDDAEANHHVDRQEPGSSGFCMSGSFPEASRKALLYSCLCLCWGFFFQIVLPYLKKNLQEVTESQLILANCGCACACVAKEEGT